MTTNDAAQAYLDGKAFDPVQFVTDLVGDNPDRAISWMAEDISWWLPGKTDFGGGTHKGVDGIRKFLTFGEWLYSIPPEVTWAQSHLFPGGALLEVEVKAVTKMDRPYHNRYALVFDLNDAGKVQAIREYHDPEPLYIAAEGIGKNPNFS